MVATVLVCASAAAIVPTVRADSNEGTTTRTAHAVLTAGLGHTCVVVGGTAKCFGANNYGQVGNNSGTDALLSQDVSGLSSGVSAISAGDWHNCALVTGGGVKCWGRNTSGQLGNNSLTNQRTPVNVSGMSSGINSLTGGSLHTCALTAGGGVKCWGYGASGQLGNGGTAVQKTPVDVTGLTSGVTAITAGLHHTCALTSGGGVKCWGEADAGRVLGNGSTTDQSTPIDVAGLTSGVTAVSAGEYHTCALLTGGTVRCWGRNNYGQIGNASWDHQSLPVDVAGLPAPVVSIAAGGYHTCAVTTAGAATCWGLGSSGQVGHGAWTSENIPADVVGLTTGVSAVSAGQKHTCAVTTGSVVCWGLNTWGQLGAGDRDSSNVPRSPAVSVPTTSPPAESIPALAAATTTTKAPFTTVKSPTTTKAPPASVKSPTTTNAPSTGKPVTTTSIASGKATPTTSVPRNDATDTSGPGQSTDLDPGEPSDNRDFPADAPQPPSEDILRSLPEPNPPVGPIPPGIGVDVGGPGLTPGEQVDCWWLDEDGNVLAVPGAVDCGTTGNDGSFSATVPVPPGEYSSLTLVAVGRQSGKGIRQGVIVRNESSNVVTEGNTFSWWWLALVIAATLLVLLFFWRRRRDDETVSVTDA
jgi:alpha-tubulin suppressor-like RCC1 family protein